MIKSRVAILNLFCEIGSGSFNVGYQYSLYDRHRAVFDLLLTI